MAEKTETVGDIVKDIHAAIQRMGAKNSHKHLLMRCGTALISLATRVSTPPVQAEPHAETIGYVAPVEAEQPAL